MHPSRNGPHPHASRAHALGSALVLALTLAACQDAGPTTTAPDAPTNVTATPGPGYVTVDWEHSGTGVSTFEVAREAEGAGAGVTRAAVESVATVDADVRQVVDHDIVIGQSYTYTVIANGPEGSSEGTPHTGDPVAVASDVDLVVGTYDDATLASPATSFGVYFFIADADLPVDGGTLAITGPAGWNGDVALEFPVTATSLQEGFLWAGPPFEPVEGTYTLHVILDGDAYVETATLDDATSFLDRPTDIDFTNVSASEVTASWTAVPGAESYVVRLFASPATFVDMATTTDATITFDGLDLAIGDHFVTVLASNVDRTGPNPPVKPERLDTSYVESPTFELFPVLVSID